VRAKKEPATDSSSNTIEAVAAAIDRAALSAGPFSAPPPLFPLPRATWQAMLRARRMRVFDWIVDAGFRLLNVLPQANRYFLACAERCDLQNKYSVARNLWPSIRKEIEDGGGWLDAIAQTEILLVELHEPRPFAMPPSAESDAVTLSRGVRLVQIKSETLPLHDSIPEFSLPIAVAAVELSRLRQRFPRRRPLPQNALFVPGCGDEPEGRLIQLEDALISALAEAAGKGLSLAQFRDRIGSENLSSLIQIGALSRCPL
jgi:hypothetical protein